MAAMTIAFKFGLGDKVVCNPSKTWAGADGVVIGLRGEHLKGQEPETQVLVEPDDPEGIGQTSAWYREDDLIGRAS